MIEHHENKNNDRGRRISTAAARKMLGMIARNYSDDEITEILECLYGFAEEAFEDYQHGDDRTE